MLDNAYDDAQCAVKSVCFFNVMTVVYFSTVKYFSTVPVFKYLILYQYLNTSGQYLNTGTA